MHPFWSAAPALPEDIHCLRTLMANVVMVGSPASSRWVLIDAGLRGFGEAIVGAAAERFNDASPQAIILTHGHFDHVGTLPHLLAHWDCPVYAHPLEMPYLTGKRDYPPANPRVGGGLMTTLSPLYPHDATLVRSIEALPADGSVPGMPEWHWIHTPGHTEGHVSLFRGRDRCVIAGDAFITVKQESAWAVLMQEQTVHGPPAYFTTDWQEASASVKRLASLRPNIAVTGHGLPMAGQPLRQQLEYLAAHFDALAVPKVGRTVH